MIVSTTKTGSGQTYLDRTRESSKKIYCLFLFRKLFDPSFKGGFMRPKYDNGTWLTPFDEFGWEGALRPVVFLVETFRSAFYSWSFYALFALHLIRGACCYAGDNGEFTEAAPWQYRFYVPHEPKALAELYGDSTELCDYLTQVR